MLLTKMSLINYKKDVQLFPFGVFSKTDIIEHYISIIYNT